MSCFEEQIIKQSRFTTIIQSNQNDSQLENIIDRFLEIKLLDNSIHKCYSNQDFATIWSKMIEQYNLKNVTNPIIMQNTVKIEQSSILGSLRPILTILLILSFIAPIRKIVKTSKKNGTNISKMMEPSHSSRFRQKVDVKFQDVVGMQKAKQQIIQFIDFLSKPEKYRKLGARIPKGALLTGPPGTGKTMIAKACAGESNVPFFTISGSEFVEMYVGVGAKRVRDLFNQAKQSSPSIIFIDEIDAVGKKRTSGLGMGGNDQRDSTLNQLLTQMDGFNTNSNVIVFAATNQKDVLDAALTRPGRFDRIVQIDLPDLQGRKEIFLIHLKPIVIDQHYKIQHYAKRMANLTPGFSGADIKNLCNEAAIIAARQNKQFVSLIDFELATQRIIGGIEKKSILITNQTKKIVAYHQCGHGVVSWFLKYADPLLKLTIIPRSKGALGFAQYLPNENKIMSYNELIDKICVILGGRITEQIFFNSISTGSYDDLQKVYKITKNIITQLGMGSQSLSWLSYSQTQYTKQYSYQIEEIIDQEIMNIIKSCTKRTKKIIEDKKHLIQQLAQILLEKQTIDQQIIQSILGQKQHQSKEFKNYISQKQKNIVTIKQQQQQTKNINYKIY